MRFRFPHISLFLLLLASASNTFATPPIREITVPVEGPAVRLKLEDNGLTFCDKRGGRRLDLTTHKEKGYGLVCPDQPPRKTSCKGLASVAPLAEVIDCASNDQWIAWSQGSEVHLVVTSSITVLSK